ncbi:Heat shock transcription factor [Marasmius crinis-equi]|uniref:Heat shock transcription factor n=1 Tax=Marasmius crinis-equi TaxID=585013 RepID=A0ABR3FNL7_9AGAR
MASGRQIALANSYGVAPPSAKVPMFLQKLYKIVSDPSTNDVICWSDTGDSFFVHDHERLAKEHLGHWFKHNKFASFVRQLNMYGFHKIPHLQQGVLRSDSDAEHSQFAHPDFHRGQEDRLIFIERKKQPGNSRDANAIDMSLGPSSNPAPQTSSAPTQQLDWHSVVSGIGAIRRHQTNISSELAELKRSNQLLWQESIEARQRHQRQQDTINRIIKFLAGVFGQQVSNSPREKDDGESSPHPVVPGSRLMIEGRKQGPGKVEITEVQDEENMSPVESRNHSPRPYMAETPATTISRPLSRTNSDISTPLLKDNPSFPTPSFLEIHSPLPEAPASPAVSSHKNSNANSSIISTQPRYPASDITQESLNGQTLPSSNSPSFDVKFQNALSQLSVSDIQQLFASLSAQNNASGDPSSSALFQNQEYPQQSSSQLTPYKPPFELGGPFSPKGSHPAESKNDGLISFDNEAAYRMDQNWKVSDDIEKDVNAVNSGIDSLIETLGLNPTMLGESGGTGVDSSNTNVDPSTLLNSNGLATDASLNTSEHGTDEFFGTYLYDPSLDFTVPDATANTSNATTNPSPMSPATFTAESPDSSKASPTSTATGSKGRKRPNPNEVAMKLYLPPNPRAKRQKK